jgi:hypothetical protein
MTYKPDASFDYSLFPSFSLNCSYSFLLLIALLPIILLSMLPSDIIVYGIPSSHTFDTLLVLMSDAFLLLFYDGFKLLLSY